MPDIGLHRPAATIASAARFRALGVSAAVHLVLGVVAGLFTWSAGDEGGAAESIDVLLSESTPYLAEPEPPALAFAFTDPAEGAPRAAESEAEIPEPNLGNLLAELDELREPLEPDFPSADLLGMTVSGQGGAPGPGGEGDGPNVGVGEGDGRGANFFGVQGGGRSFVYVVDCSGSMSTPTYYATTRLQRVQWELAQSISRLDESIQFYVIFFSSRMITMPTDGLVAATAENRQAAIEWLMTVRASGGTEPGIALRRALELEPDVIFLLSDGEFSRLVVRATTELNEDGVTIHTIGFGAGASSAVLAPLAQENGGYYRYVP